MAIDKHLTVEAVRQYQELEPGGVQFLAEAFAMPCSLFMTAVGEGQILRSEAELRMWSWSLRRLKILAAPILTRSHIQRAVSSFVRMEENANATN